MKQVRPVRGARSPRERIRELGFDPDQLTLEEQDEILDLHVRFEVGSANQRLVAPRR
ncbi:MAG TPA: hypothetical protein VMN39_03665 [Longimicrobiaceae bacterium]|nr:hypothetical protein [Longimicrobiaceae bacterium]